MRVSSIIVASLIVACGGGTEPPAKAQPAGDAPAAVDASVKGGEVEPAPPVVAKPAPPVVAEPDPPVVAEPDPAELPDLTWWCACYSESAAAGPQPIMGCWSHKAECLELERLGRTGSATVVADSLVTRCQRTYGDPPGNAGFASDWQQPGGPLTRQNRKGCLIPADTPIEVERRPKAATPPSPDPQPEKLEALVAKYRTRRMGAGDDFELRQARRWHKVDYRERIIEAAEGDEAALAVIMGLELDGAGADIHSGNLETLLLGLGDEAFAKVLATQPKKTIILVLETLDWAIQTIEPSDPSHYRKTHRKTYALEPRRPRVDRSKEARPWWCTCTKRDGAAVTSCRERVEACAAVEQAAIAVARTDLEKACRTIVEVHPGDSLGGREAWSAAADGGWERAGECVLAGAADTPSRVRTGAPEPRLLTALAELYAAGSDTDPLPKQAKSWYRVDYRALVAKAAEGDEAAAGKLVGLRIEGGAIAIHASTVDSLMRGYGDERFAALLAGLPRSKRETALWTLDVLDGRVDLPSHYRHEYPRTFAAGDHVHHRDE